MQKGNENQNCTEQFVWDHPQRLNVEAAWWEGGCTETSFSTKCVGLSFAIKQCRRGQISYQVLVRFSLNLVDGL